MTKEESSEYGRGYVAGRKRLDKDLAHEAFMKHQSDVWQKYMAAAIDFAFTQSTWLHGGEIINTLDARIELAVLIADAALLKTKSKGRL